MKLFRLLSTTAVTVLAIAALAISASAAPDTTTVTANYADSTLTLSGVPAVTGEDDATLLVLNNNVFADFDADETGETTVTITPADIKQINQSDNTADFAEVVVGELADGDKVYVRMQVNGQIYTAEYTKKVDTPDTVLVGDVNGDGSITSDDATEILCSTVDLESVIVKEPKNDAYYAAAYCTDDLSVTSDDATEILCKTVDLECNANVGKDIAIGSIN